MSFSGRNIEFAVKSILRAIRDKIDYNNYGGI